MQGWEFRPHRCIGTPFWRSETHAAGIGLEKRRLRPGPLRVFAHAAQPTAALASYSRRLPGPSVGMGVPIPVIVTVFVRFSAGVSFLVETSVRRHLNLHDLLGKYHFPGKDPPDIPDSLFHRPVL